MKNKSLLDSFNNALCGVIYVLKNERNFKIHFAAAFTVFLFCLFLNVELVEFLILLLCITVVLVAELFNTAVEAIVDLYCGSKRNQLAKVAKDAAAGGVFLTSLNAVVAGYLIIFRKLLDIPVSRIVIDKIIETPVYVTLVCCLVVTMITIVVKAMGKSEGLLQGGMPSTHSAVSFCLATCVLLLYESNLVVFIAYLLAALVAQSRVEGNIHSIIQVAMGGMIGVFSTILIFQIFFLK